MKTPPYLTLLTRHYSAYRLILRDGCRENHSRGHGLAISKYQSFLKLQARISKINETRGFNGNAFTHAALAKEFTFKKPVFSPRRLRALYRIYTSRTYGDLYGALDYGYPGVCAKPSLDLFNKSLA